MANSFYSRFRKYQYTTAIPLSLIVIDTTLVVATLRLVYQYTWLGGVPHTTFGLFASNAALCWLVAALLVSVYQIENLGGHRKLFFHWAAASATYLGLLLLLMVLLPSLQFSPHILMPVGLATLPLLVVKVILLHAYRFYRHQNPHQKRAVIVGDTLRGRELGHYFTKNRSLPQIFLGYFADHPEQDLLLSDRYLGMTHHIQQYCLDHKVNEIYYVMPNNSELMEELAVFAEQNFIYFGIVPDVGTFLGGNRRIDAQLHDDSRIPVISTRKAPLRLMVNAQVKRIFDVVFSLLALAFLVPFVFPIIALAIKLESQGPIFFKQLRPGRNNQLFWCYKFRTMAVNSDSEMQASRNDRRITRVGAFLRKTSLDELPQFLNVLFGDMSVVGPRPNLVKHLEEYPREISEYSLRHQITPGITGYAQISGFRGETRETHMMQKRVEHDLWYIENWSLAFDIKIIGRTIWNVVAGEENAY